MRTLNLIAAVIFMFTTCEDALAQVAESRPLFAETADISKSISLYPNPTTDFIHIKLGLLNSSQAKLSMHNILGSEITIESEVIDDHELRVRVKDLPTGYYLLAVRDEATQFRGTYKFLKR
jgi:hypothetical protein